MPLSRISQITALLMLLATGSRTVAQTVDIGNRLELFVDDQLLAEKTGDVEQVMIRPKPKMVVFETDEPWEGNTSGYYSFLQDGDTYRMIYRGWQHDNMKAAHPEVTCYAESKDGVRWTKPVLDLFDWKGSKQNNIVWRGSGTHNFTAFLDTNPAATKAQRYKALGGVNEFGGGLILFASPDAIHWTQLTKKPVITHGAFDSQNLAFWDEDRKEYRAYWRYFGKGVRAIRTATSPDMLHWEHEADLTYTEGTPVEHLYTNAIQKYYRAPHLFIGFPTRYEPKSQQVEPVLMTSRNGTLFHRYPDPVIPRTAPKDRNHNRSNYMAWGMFSLPGKPNEIAVYGTENYYENSPGRVRLFTYRTDGFVALRASKNGGVAITKPLRYKGEQLLLNYVVAPDGMLTIETVDDTGMVTGKSKPLTGDQIDKAVEWEVKPTLNEGVVRLRMTMENADVYSLRFQ